MNVEDLLTKKGIYYIPKGADVIVQCLNPEHDDKNPSCRIHKITGAIHCFSCGFSGNIFALFGIQRDFIGEKAFQLLNKIQDIKMTTSGLTIPVGSLPFSRDYRNISGDTYQKFEAFTNDAEEYKDRLIFPLRDITGRIVVFQGRHFFSNDKQRKYYNFPSHVRLFPYPQIVKPVQRSIILVEGIFDMLNLHDKGLTNVVCSFGTITLSENNMNLLSPFKFQGVNKIFVMFDGDEAGNKNAKLLVDRIIKASMFEAEVITIEEGSDPGEFSRKEVDLLRGSIYEEL